MSQIFNKNNIKEAHNLIIFNLLTLNFGIHVSYHWVFLILILIVLTLVGAFCSGMGVGFCNIDTLQL
jgi:ABC-type polysaccharide/polyol phosphate export permease